MLTCHLPGPRHPTKQRPSTPPSRPVLATQLPISPPSTHPTTCQLLPLGRLGSPEPGQGLGGIRTQGERQDSGCWRRNQQGTGPLRSRAAELSWKPFSQATPTHHLPPKEVPVMEGEEGASGVAPGCLRPLPQARSIWCSQGAMPHPATPPPPSPWPGSTLALRLAPTPSRSPCSLGGQAQGAHPTLLGRPRLQVPLRLGRGLILSRDATLQHEFRLVNLRYHNV